MQRLCPFPSLEEDGIYHMAVSMLPHDHLPAIHDVEATRKLGGKGQQLYYYQLLISLVLMLSQELLHLKGCLASTACSYDSLTIAWVGYISCCKYAGDVGCG